MTTFWRLIMTGILLLLFAVWTFAEHKGFEAIERLPVVVEASCFVEELERRYPCEVRIDNKKNIYLTIYVNGKLKLIFIYEEGWQVLYNSKFDL